MRRSERLGKGAMSGLVAAAMVLAACGAILAGAAPAQAPQPGGSKGQPAPPAPLKPSQGSIPVAFLLSEGAVVIDFTGPWEVFQDASVQGLDHDAFRLYTVAETTRPIRTSGGMQIIPDYDFESAPAPKVIVIPAQSTRSPAAMDWIRKYSKTDDVTMSVCTGAFVLAKTGLLSGKAATTHHTAYSSLAMAYPDIKVRRGARFVEEGSLATAGGLSSGIDLALRVVERYYGRDVAKDTAYQMEYQGQGWLDPDSNQVYAAHRTSTDEHPLCPVCEMEMDPSANGILKSEYKGKTYYFCSEDHKKLFDSAPEKVLAAAGKP
jgi:putative intracellular protease/amidase/YHS domain-containing protein